MERNRGQKRKANSKQKPKELRIFISYKMLAHNGLAKQIGELLSRHNTQSVIVVHAGLFQPGKNYRELIRTELDRTHWLIFLKLDADGNIDKDENWEYCMFECGFFDRATMRNSIDKRLITFCLKPEQIDDALREFNAIVVNEKSVVELLKDIYWEEPWKIGPGLSSNELERTASDIVNAIKAECFPGVNFDVTSSLTLEFTVNSEVRSALQDGRLPDNVSVRGTRDWHKVFGRALDISEARWRELAEKWAYKNVYEFLIAKMISDALSSNIPKGTVLRAPGFNNQRSNDLFRITLRRYEQMRDNRYRFHFTAARLDLPYDLSETTGISDRAVLYHLVNLTWYFHQRIVDGVYKRILELNSKKDNQIPQEVYDAYDVLGRELMEITSQAIMRGLDNPLPIERALDTNDEAVRVLLDEMREYTLLRKRIFDLMPKGEKSLQEIESVLQKMAMMNYKFYRVIAKRYSEISEELPEPEIRKDTPDPLILKEDTETNLERSA